jgi:hypothetical protein
LLVVGRWGDGQKRVLRDSPPTGKISKGNGSTFGCFSQGHSEFRAGLAKDPNPCPETVIVPSGYEGIKIRQKALLGPPGMLLGNKRKMSCLGISQWAPLLVYQWDLVSRRGPSKLGKQNEDMQKM